MDAVSKQLVGGCELDCERLEIRVDIPAIERELGYRDEAMSTVEALHEDIYFGLLEVFQLHSGRPLGSRGLQPGQIVPDVRRAAQGGASVRIATEAYESVSDVASAASGLPLEQIDAPLTPGEDNKLLDYLPDTQNPGPDSETFEHALTESIEEVLSTLKEREAKILRLYFGLDGPEPMTLEEIGSLLGITRERVRQIKEKALSRLRHVSRARALESFLA